LYAAAVAAIFSQFPHEVVDFVCDPRTGLPRTLKWLPTIAEIAEACEERVRWSARIDKELRPLVERRRNLIADLAASGAAKAEAQRWLDERSSLIENNGL
jgi:hypothetical protein